MLQPEIRVPSNPYMIPVSSFRGRFCVGRIRIFAIGNLHDYLILLLRPESSNTLRQ